MNGSTRNDLSGGTVKLDYIALVRTAQFAFRELLESVNGLTHELYATQYNYTSRYIVAKRLALLAADLAIAADTLAALEAGITRPVKLLVNVPLVVED